MNSKSMFRDKKIQQNQKLIIQPLNIEIPKRTSTNNTIFNPQRSKVQSFVTNYYQTKDYIKLMKVYQYQIESDNLQSDATDLFNKAVFFCRKRLNFELGLISWRGTTIWGTKQCKAVKNVQSFYRTKQENKKSQQYPVELKIKYVKEINFSDFYAGDKKNVDAIPVFNSNIKGRFQKMDMDQLGKGKYYDMMNQKTIELQNDFILISTGTKMSIFNINSIPLAQIDISHRVLRRANFLEDLQSGKPEQFIGMSVMMRYGKRITYEIQSIDYNQSPNSSFFYQTRYITYIQYYKTRYNQTITNLRQPLVKVIQNKKCPKRIINGKIINEEQKDIFLVPQLVSLVGMKDNIRTNHKIMKAISQQTRMSPKQRFKRIQNSIERFNKTQGLFKIGKLIQVKGYQITKPQIKLAPKVKIQISKEGKFQLKEKSLYERGNLNDCIMFYSTYQHNKQESYKNASIIARQLEKISIKFGLQTNPIALSHVLLLKENKKYIQQKWSQQINTQLVRFKQMPQFVLFILNQKQKNIYAKIKSQMLCSYKEMISSSFIIKNKLFTNNHFDYSKGLSILTNVLVQINAKLGYCPWLIPIRTPYFINKKVAISSLVFSKGKKKNANYCMGFLGTINQNLNQVFSYSKIINNPKQKMQTKNPYQDSFNQWLKSYYKNTNCLPQVLIVYREGLSASQINKKRFSHEIAGLMETIEKIKKKTLKECRALQSYNPQIIYISVDKRINTRFYINNQNGNFDNPGFGSVIVQPLSSADSIDFHLVPHYVSSKIGVAKPTRYRIIWQNNMNAPIQDIAEFTYDQCYNYFNWSGGTRIPGIMMGSNKLAKMIGESIKQKVISTGINKWRKNDKGDKYLGMYWFL